MLEQLTSITAALKQWRINNALTRKSKDRFILDQCVNITLDIVDWKRKQVHFKIAVRSDSENSPIADLMAEYQ